MVLTNLLFVLLFLLSALLQYNDPDPLLWGGMYLYGAAICLMAVGKRFSGLLCAAGLLFFGGYSVYLFFSDHGVYSWLVNHQGESLFQSMKATKPWIEETREFLGLVLLQAALVMNAIWFYRIRRANTPGYSFRKFLFNSNIRSI